MRDFLNSFIEITDEEYRSFMALSKTESFKKGEYLLQADRPVQELFFVKSGFLRGYRIEQGADITHHFYFDKWLATDYESYLTGNQGELFIQAIVDTTVYKFNRNTLYDFYKSHPKFEKLRFIQAEDAYVRMVRRLKSFQNMDLKERYLALVNKAPELFELVQHWQIASYLGVTPQSLSRIRKTLD